MDITTMPQKNRLQRLPSAIRTLLCAAMLWAASGPARAEDPGAPASRPFRLGFTRWPSELSLRGIQQADDFLGKHADLVSVMFIGGIPWPEALDGKPFSPDVQNQLNYRRPNGYELLLSISPLNQDRQGLAPYWGEKDNQPLPPEWAQRPFNSPEVTSAFTRFTLRSVEALQPDYLAIGIESNVLLSKDRRAWPDYKEFHKAVYGAVKKAHPGLPVFFTTEVNHYLERAAEARGSHQREEVAELMKYSNVFAMSCYPHMSYDTPWPIPEDYFRFAQDFGKPLAVAETGMLSRSVTVFNLKLRGSEADQRQYYDVLLRTAQRDNYLFIATFATTDFERLVAQLPQEARDLATIWAYTGLQTSDGQPKPALELWDRFLALPLKRDK
jgi:hypothetical protein